MSQTTPQQNDNDADKIVSDVYNQIVTTIEAAQTWPQTHSEFVLSFTHEKSGLTWHTSLTNDHGRIYLEIFHTGNSTNRAWSSDRLAVGALIDGSWQCTIAESRYSQWRRSTKRQLPKINARLVF